MEAYWKAEDRAEEKVNKATTRLRKAQQVYANKNNMKVVDGKGDIELEQKMARITAVNNYWREIYLQFFKVSKEYDQLWELLSKEKAEQIDQQRMKVVKTVESVLPVLRAETGFNGDVEFRDQTITLIEYYQQVATTDFAKIVDVLSIKPTQKEIDLVNSIINKCNADHERLVYNWNIASQDLFKKNVDKN
jgi:mRNA-degrading endonuclease HigB of HigAB toxin-antitoxin module